MRTHLGRLGLQRHQPRGGVGQDVEMRGGWGAHGGGPALGVHLVVDEAPLLQEGVDPAEEEKKKRGVGGGSEEEKRGGLREGGAAARGRAACGGAKRTA